MKIFNRRKFLATMGAVGYGALFFDPVKSFAKAFIEGQINLQKGRALHPKQSAKNFVQFNLYGSPSRWQFDHILRPSDSDRFIQCNGVYNRIQNIDSQSPQLSRGEYSDVRLKNLNVPHLWAGNVAGATGNSRKMAALLDNMLIIRGCDIGTNGHPLANEQQVCPKGGGFSINGLVADYSAAGIPAVCVGRSPASSVFKSELGQSMVKVPLEHPNYLEFLLNSFTTNSLSANQDALLASAGDLLQEYSAKNNAGSELLYRDRDLARKLLKSSMANFRDAFPALEKKYSRIFSQTLALSDIPGVTDKPIPCPSFPCSLKGRPSVKAAFSGFYLSQKIIADGDIRTIFNTVKANYYAKQFAVTEFLLTEGLSGSILLTPPDSLEQANFLLSDLGGFGYHSVADIQEKFDESTGLTTFSVRGERAKKEAGYWLAMDAHETGWISNVISTSLFYRGFSACLLELSDTLRAKESVSGNLWQNTIIQVASEFDRKPFENGSQLAHFPKAHVTSFLGGRIPGPVVLGNIYSGEAGAPGLPPGTLGTAAPVDGLKGKSVSLGNISSTLSDLLGVPHLVKDQISLISPSKNKFGLAVEKGKNIVG